MPRALANNKVKVKPEPYPSSSASSSPSKSVTSQSKGKRLTWTEEMDQKIMAHVLNCSNIEFVFNWEDLIKDEFPEITKKQLANHWDKKLKGVWFPTEVTKKAKPAKDGTRKDVSLTGSGEE